MVDPLLGSGHDSLISKLAKRIQLAVGPCSQTAGNQVARLERPRREVRMGGLALQLCLLMVSTGILGRSDVKVLHEARCACCTFGPSPRPQV